MNSEKNELHLLIWTVNSVNAWKQHIFTIYGSGLLNKLKTKLNSTNMYFKKCLWSVVSILRTEFVDMMLCPQMLTETVQLQSYWYNKRRDQNDEPALVIVHISGAACLLKDWETVWIAFLNLNPRAMPKEPSYSMYISDLQITHSCIKFWLRQPFRGGFIKPVLQYCVH